MQTIGEGRRRSSSFSVGVATGVTSLVEDNGSVGGLRQC
jgi:hypothetical protein